MTDMIEAEIHMWEYWRDKYGHSDTLKLYYPNLLESNTQLQAALAQLQSAELLIDKNMKDLK